MSLSVSTENQLIIATENIGNISGCNCHFTAELVSKIDKTGKSVFELTVAELIQLDKEVTKQFNKIN